MQHWITQYLLFALACGPVGAQGTQPKPSVEAPKPADGKPAVPPAPGRVGTVQFDASGWPIVGEAPEGHAPAQPAAAKTVPAAPAAETARPKATNESGPPMPEPDARPAAPALASGSQLGSPLLEVFQATRAPGAFRELGGVVVWWRLTTWGSQGEVIGVREVTHTADCAFAERDRLEHTDGRVYGRSGASVFAERGGMPWPTLNESAQHELGLFGLHLRLPWCFGDASAFAVVGRDTVVRSGETLARVTVERRPPAGSDVIGPELDPAPRDRFEVLYEPTSGRPCEFVHRFANTMQTRRVLLEDWRDVGGVRMPFRRVYVDEALRPTTTVEVLRVEPSRTSERDFRLR